MGALRPFSVLTWDLWLPFLPQPFSTQSLTSHTAFSADTPGSSVLLVTRKARRVQANSSALLSTLLVSLCQLVSALLVCRDYFHSNIHTLWTMHTAFQTDSGKEMGTRRDHFQRDSGAGLIHMNKSCPNTWKNTKFRICDTTGALEPNKYDAVWHCTYLGCPYSVAAVLQSCQLASKYWQTVKAAPFKLNSK